MLRNTHVRKFTVASLDIAGISGSTTFNFSVITIPKEANISPAKRDLSDNPVLFMYVIVHNMGICLEPPGTWMQPL